ncbi:MAG: M6 family metalloprotease domain-containing protein [Paludibacteraceae bacterium]
MRKIIINTFITLLFVLTYSDLHAVPAYPYPVKITQPDGTTLTIRLKGDEFHHYHVTDDDYLIIKNPNGVFNYATLDTNGNLVDTKVKANDKNIRSNAEKSFVSGLKMNVSATFLNQQMRSNRMKASNILPQKVYPKTGSPKALVILANFSDLSFITSAPQTAFTNMLNQQGYSANGGTGSARDYFTANSMGKFTPVFDVVGPVTLPQTMAYYGTNDANGQDQNAVQMIVDACAAADKSGVDFSQYDTDNDGLVDNVFVYYAGHNEAENAPANTVWPHRWGIYPTFIYSNGNYTGTPASVTFDGKRVEDYACTSELRGSTGSNMAGIGTFTHEFGHVLGLADMYPTDGSTHQTLSYWDIMDAGPYLNSGRTPPSYNSFERFQLGYLTPTVLTNAQNVSLSNLSENNTAYLIPSVDNFRVYAENTSEYFLMENRQKKGWDTYLPGHGMLIYRINYNPNDWNYNQPNNNPLKMGVDIMEADGIASDATLSGDPFPGTRNVTVYVPQLRSGVILENDPVIAIQETNDMIIFKYKGGVLTPPVATPATDVTYKNFVANWEPLTGVSGYYLTVNQMNEDGTNQTIVADKWTTQTKDTIYYLISDKSYEYKVKGSYISTNPKYEIITDYSNTIQVHTLPYPFDKELRVVVNSGIVKVFVPVKGATVNVFNTLGQKIRSISPDSDIIDITDLPKGIVFIIQSDKYRTKIIL